MSQETTVNRAEKTQQITELHEVFARVGDVFLVDMTGLKVPEVTELRRRIKAAAGSCRASDTADPPRR